MVIPDKLCLLLERLFAKKYGDKLVEPNEKERIAIYKEALLFVEVNLNLFAYLLGHRLLVTTFMSCPEIDEIILHYACRDQRIIPQDFRTRMPRGASVVPMLERLYMRDKEYKKLFPEHPYTQPLLMAAE